MSENTHLVRTVMLVFNDLFNLTDWYALMPLRVLMTLTVRAAEICGLFVLCKRTFWGSITQNYSGQILYSKYFFNHTCQVILCKVLLQLFLMTKETAKIECFANRARVSYVYQSYFDILKCIHLFFILCNLILNRNNIIKHYKIH